MGLPTTPLDHSRRGWGSTLGGRALIPEEEAITYIALAAAGGDRLKAEALYLSAARSGELSVYGRRSMSGLGRELMPRERWQVAVHQALPDPLCGVFHFTREGWCDREVRRLELEQLWPVVASSSAAAERRQRKKGSELPRVLELMRKAGLAQVESMTAKQMAKAFGTSLRTAERALKALREEDIAKNRSGS